MNTHQIEDRVRAATRAAADTVAPDSVPPLRLSPERPSRSRAGSFASVWGRRLAPMAAAAAVVAVAVAMVTVGQTVRMGGAETGPSSPSRPGPVTTGPPISSYVASGQVPRYYVSIESHSNPNFNPSYAVVRATATGAAAETVSPPTGQTVLAVTAAADDRTFVLDTQPWVSANSNANQNFEPRTFFELRLGGDGSIVSLHKLSISVPGGELMTGFALSSDGNKLAIAVQPDNNKREPDLTEVKVIVLATGATTTWTGNGVVGIGPDDARSLSWPDHEQTLAFTWTAAGPGVHTGLWLLDLTTAGGSLLAHSREAVSLLNEASLGAAPVPSSIASLPLNVSASPSGPAGATVSDSATGGGAVTPTVSPSTISSVSPSAMPSVSPSAMPSVIPSASPILQSATPPACQLDSIVVPDGTAIVCGAITELDQKDSLTSSGPAVTSLQRGAETEFIEYSTGNGKVTRILGHWTFGSVGALAIDVLWSNASGSVLIGVIPDSGDGRAGVISGNEFTPLPATAVSGTW
jgi:hypothetical protein